MLEHMCAKHNLVWQFHRIRHSSRYFFSLNFKAILGQYRKFDLISKYRFTAKTISGTDSFRVILSHANTCNTTLICLVSYQRGIIQMINGNGDHINILKQTKQILQG